MTWDEFINKMSILCGKHRIEYSEDSIIYKIENKSSEYKKLDYEKLYEETREWKISNFMISNGDNHEILIKKNDRMIRYYRILESGFVCEDNDIKYQLQEISDIMMLNIISMMNEELLRKLYLNGSMLHRRLLMQEKNISFIELIKSKFTEFNSILITSKKNVNEKKINDCANSFLFNICYNFGISFSIINNSNELFNFKINNKFRNVKDTELNAPKLLYKPELLEKYHMAVTAKDVFVEFMGFYQILEYFYEEIYKEEIISEVKKYLVKPDFLIKNNKQIIGLIELINRKRSGNTTGNELNALELTLIKYANDIEDIKDKLSNYDNIVDYYKDNTVKFSKGNKIDWMDDRKKVLKNLSERIYKTRNALVHNKSNEIKTKERGVYRPFKDTEILSKEIPLIKILAEEVIINSAKEL